MPLVLVVVVRQASPLQQSASAVQECEEPPQRIGATQVPLVQVCAESQHGVVAEQAPPVWAQDVFAVWQVPLVAPWGITQP